MNFINEIVGQLGLDMGDSKETTDKNLKIIDSVLSYFSNYNLFDELAGGNLEVVFSDDFDRFYRDKEVDIVDRIDDVLVVRVHNGLYMSDEEYFALDIYDVFNVMRNIGWNLNDFPWTLKHHKETLLKIIEERKVDADSIRYMSEFVYDFIEAVEKIAEEGI